MGTSQDIRIPVPYGNLVAKTWNESTGHPVLALHGWQDSAASFDALIPLLPSSLYVVCLDFSGHGLSSHKPRGSHYNSLEYLIDVKRTIDHLKWKTFTILGHSLGCSVGLTYASLYPNNVKCVIGLDLMSPLLCREDDLANTIRQNIENYLDIESKMTTPPSYQEEDLFKRFKNANPCVLTDKAVDILLSRGTVKGEDGRCRFTRDVRTRVLRSVIYPFSAVHKMLHNYKGSLLIITAAKSEFGYLNKKLEPFIELYKSTCHLFKHEEVDGGHYVHLNEPNLVAEVMCPFLNSVLNSAKT